MKYDILDTTMVSDDWFLCGGGGAMTLDKILRDYPNWCLCNNDTCQESLNYKIAKLEIEKLIIGGKIEAISEMKNKLKALLPEKISSTGALQEHELVAMIDLNKESLIPREKGTLLFNETELHQLVVKLIAEYQNNTVDQIQKAIEEWAK